MAFSRAQQGRHYRPMVERAWQVFSRESGCNPKDKITRDHWYRGELLNACGSTTTKTLNPRRDFEKAMAHFEAICGDGITWQMKCASGPLRSARMALELALKSCGREKNYAEGIASQMSFPSLKNCDVFQLGKVISALKIHISRSAD